MLVRSLAVLVAIVMLVLTAHVNITAHGGYGSTFSFLTAATALGLIAGSIAIGQCAAERRPVLATLFVLLIAAGETFTFINTAERVVVSREERQAPLREREATRAKLKARIEAAEATLAAIPTTTERIRMAEAAKAAADAAVIAKSAERNCASNCRELLQAQVDSAQAELNAARAELASKRAAAEHELREASRALEATPALASATPLADRIGVSAWIIDLAQSALGSLAANGLACALLVFGTHPRRRETVEVVEPAWSVSEPLPKPLPARKLIKQEATAKGQAPRFACECLEPGGEADLDAIMQRYRGWCKARGLTPLPDRDIAVALADLFSESGLDCVERDDRLMVIGASIKKGQEAAE